MVFYALIDVDTYNNTTHNEPEGVESLLLFLFLYLYF